MEKKEGDFVDIDEIIAVIETDKVKVDIRSPERGQITKFHAALGDTVEVLFYGTWVNFLGWSSFFRN
jgi:2-oxoglutarate dehydrogenase E2 component (dihydrolipoamide succinyltransferase)